MNIVREDETSAALAEPLPPARAPAGGVAAPAPAANAPHRLQRILSMSSSQSLARRIQYVGKTGVGGIALVVFALAFFMGANTSLRSNVEELQATLDSVHDSPAGSSSPRELRTSAARELVASLPERAALPEITGKIVAQADAAGIALERGNYDLTVTHSGRLVRARMTFPVHGRYPDIRRFIDATLSAVPGAAVDGLRLERKDIGAAEIDADIRFAVYLRGTP